jgi:diaminopimelate epimerase
MSFRFLKVIYEMKFTKMQGAGNDFVVVDANNSRRTWSDLALKMCDRHYGIGADGLLISLPSKVADFKMRIFNADGSESAVCGNGLRCLVKHYIDANKVKNNSEVKVETSIGVRTARIHRLKDKATEIQVNMGEPRIGLNSTSIKDVRQRKELDIMSAMDRSVTVNKQELLLSLVSIGNPHAIHFYDSPVADFPLAELGLKVEQHNLFPDETNFEVVRIISRKKVEARVWERGVGETLACGSGACAIVVAGNLLGWLDNEVEVNLPGGVIKVEWRIKNDSGIYLSGPTETVFNGEW